MNKTMIFQVQVVLVLAIGVVTQSLNAKDAVNYIARYVLYLLSLKAVEPACQLLHKLLTGGRNITGNIEKVFSGSRNYVTLYVAWLTVLVYNGQTPFQTDFVYLCLAFLLIKYQDMDEPRININYGVGMACSFFEGYLVYTIPSDGANFRGFEENVKALEDFHGVLFPSKKLFIVITKNMFCPPDLKDFNKSGRTDLSTMEFFAYLKNVVKSVAGVKDRVYQHTAYKILRPADTGAPPVCVMAECATPLHTLHRVLNNRTLYKEVADIDVAGVVDDFCTTLTSILDNSPECQGKCELVYYDNTDPEQNLADVLLARIRHLVPDFEKQILARRGDNLIEEDVK